MHELHQRSRVMHVNDGGEVSAGTFGSAYNHFNNHLPVLSGLNSGLEKNPNLSPAWCNVHRHVLGVRVEWPLVLPDELIPS